MKKAITTIVAVSLLSATLAGSAYAGERHMNVFNPLWLPVAIATSVAATVDAITPRPVIVEHRTYMEPRRTVVYEEPPRTVYVEPEHHHYRDRYRPDYRYDRGHDYDGPRYREYYR